MDGTQQVYTHRRLRAGFVRDQQKMFEIYCHTDAGPSQNKNEVSYSAPETSPFSMQQATIALCAIVACGVSLSNAVLHMRVCCGSYELTTPYRALETETTVR